MTTSTIPPVLPAPTPTNDLRVGTRTPRSGQDAGADPGDFRAELDRALGRDEVDEPAEEDGGESSTEPTPTEPPPIEPTPTDPTAAALAVPIIDTANTEPVVIDVDAPVDGSDTTADGAVRPAAHSTPPAAATETTATSLDAAQPTTAAVALAPSEGEPVVGSTSPAVPPASTDSDGSEGHTPIASDAAPESATADEPTPNDTTEVPAPEPRDAPAAPAAPTIDTTGATRAPTRTPDAPPNPGIPSDASGPDHAAAVVRTDELADALRATFRRGVSADQLVMQLHPAELGSVRIDVKIVDGVTHLSLRAESAAAVDRLSSGTDQLRQDLARAGVDLGGLDVRHGSTNGQPGSTPGRAGGDSGAGPGGPTLRDAPGTDLSRTRPEPDHGGSLAIDL